MTGQKLSVVVAAALAGATTAASAAISYTTEGSSYTENFDSRVNSQQANTPITFTDDSTVPGWFVYQPGGGTTLTTAGAGTASALASGLSSGSYATNFWRTVVAGPPIVYGTDVSFGTQNFNGNSAASSGTVTGGTIYFGFGLVNNTNTTLHSFTLSYNAELWSTNNTATAVDGEAVSYALGATGVADSQGTYVSTNLGFTVPVSQTTLSMTSFATPSGQVTNIDWLPGQTLFIRYGDLNVVGNDRGMGVDDIAFAASSVVPEPASLALLGFGALAGLRRRRA